MLPKALPASRSTGQAIDELRRMADEGRISQTEKRKILEDNPKAFYGL